MTTSLVTVLVLVGVLAASTVAGLAWRARNGRMIAGAGRDRIGESAPVLSPADVGSPLGARATLVQFSSAFCQPCRATRVVLGETSALVDGVRHIEIDAESHLELVRRLDVMRTPTVFVLDKTGRVVTRASGTPRKADVLAALDRAIAGIGA